MSDQLASHRRDFAEVLGHIQQTRQRVFAQANTALIELYWRIGQTLSHKVAQAGWGKGVVAELAQYIAQADPTIKGFSDKNLWRMKQFFETYQGDEKLSTLARELPWTHNVIIFSRCKSSEERAYYLRQVIADKLGKRELERAGPARPKDVDAEILVFDLEIDFIGFGQDGDGRGGRMNASRGFRREIGRAHV